MDNDDKLCGPGTMWNGMGNFNWVADGPGLPGNCTGGREQAIIDGVLWRYTGEALGLYECKSSRKNSSRYNRSRLRDYSISYTMGGSIGGAAGSFRTQGGISRASEKMVFIDTDGGLRAGSTGDPRFYWLLGAFWPFGDDLETWGFNRNPDGDPLNIITARHGNGSNMSFADGHCEYWKWKDKRTVMLAEGSLSEDDASDNNPDLKHLAKILKGRRW